MVEASLSPKEYAIELTSPLKYHRLFTLPATSSHGPLKISYSIAGPAPLPDGDSEVDVPTILFVGGMFGTRWMAVSENWLAEKEGVRVLFIDRYVFCLYVIWRFDSCLSYSCSASCAVGPVFTLYL
jgi:hypothetical protein